jgi:sugar lactone lactonase YvrE
MFTNKKPLISLENIRFIGCNLNRPECVIVTNKGNIYVPDWDGGVTCISSDGNVHSVHGATSKELKPNGIAIRRDQSFLLTNLSAEKGGIWSLIPGCSPEPYITEVDGKEIPPTNFVLVDNQDRIWITVSTTLKPRSLGYRRNVKNGFIILADKYGARIVADGLGYTNEVRISPDGKYLYVVETFSKAVSRYEITEKGDLLSRQVFTEFDDWTFPDGIAFDSSGALWVTSIFSNRVIRVLEDGSQILIIEDLDSDFMSSIENVFQKGDMKDIHMKKIESKMLKSVSSIAFGGKDLKTVYLGCLHGNQIATFRTKIKGLPMAHWKWGL